MSALAMAGKRVAWGMLVVMLCALAVTRPHVAQRYALYLGTPAAPGKAHLFLDPYPNLASCKATVAVFSANAEAAFCKGRTELEFGGAADAVLAADFASFIPRAWYCKPASRRP